MAGRFTADGRTYPDTPAGHLLAAKDKANGVLYLHGHRMRFWSKETSARPPTGKDSQVARSILRAITAGTVITIAVTVLWAWSTTVTSAGPPPIPRLTRSPLGDYAQMAGTVTGSAPAFFAVTALIYAACFTIAGLRRMNRSDA